MRAITDAEVERIFYEWYYKASGADKLPWPLNLAQADTAVNAGVERAREMLQKSGGRRTVPQIFIGERHVGGYDDLAALDRAGELDKLLAQLPK